MILGGVNGAAGDFTLRPRAVRTDPVDIRSGTGSVNVTVSDTATLPAKVATFDSQPGFGAANCPELTWDRYPGSNLWTWNSTDNAMEVLSPSPGATRVDRAWAKGGGTTASTCTTGPYGPTTSLTLTFSFNIPRAGGDTTNLWIGYASREAGQGAAHGPRFNANYVSGSTDVRWRACITDNVAGTTNCGSFVTGLARNTWHSVTLSYDAATTTVTATIGSQTSSYTGTWSTAQGIEGTVMESSITIGQYAHLKVDNLLVPSPRQGYWTSAGQDWKGVTQMGLTYAIPTDRNGAAIGSLAPVYANSSGANVWARTTAITTGTSFVLDDSTGTSGSMSAIAPPWTLAIRLYDQDGLGTTKTTLSAVAVTSTVPDEGVPGRPRPLPPTPDEFAAAVRQVCNPWAVVFIAILLAIAIAIRIRQRRGLGPT